MADISIFPDKEVTPTTEVLKEHLGNSYVWWQTLCQLVFQLYPDGKEEWNYPGRKYGWSYRIKDKKRAIIYFLPREGYFKVAFVFGQKAYDVIMESNIANEIKKELREARKYAEGRGISIAIKSNEPLLDIQTLIEIKLSN